MTEKICTKCGESKAVDLFGVDNNSKDGRRRWCKECRNKSESRANIPKSELKIDKIIDYLNQVMNNQKELSLYMQKLINRNQVDKVERCVLSESAKTKADGKIYGLTDDDKRFLGIT